MPPSLSWPNPAAHAAAPCSSGVPFMPMSFRQRWWCAGSSFQRLLPASKGHQQGRGGQGADTGRRTLAAPLLLASHTTAATTGAALGVLLGPDQLETAVAAAGGGVSTLQHPPYCLQKTSEWSCSLLFSRMLLLSVQCHAGHSRVS